MAFKAKLNTNKHRSHTVEDAISEATKDDMVGLSINISKKKRAVFKSKAAIEGKNMQDILLKAIDGYIDKSQ